MDILVIDGMGGGIGKAVIERLRAEWKECRILAVGTNALATAAMLKAGANEGATGENAVVFNSGKAKVIVGAMGIVLANAMLGEVTPRMAEAVSSSAAHKILIPVARCNATILGVAEKPAAQWIAEIPSVVRAIFAGETER